MPFPTKLFMPILAGATLRDRVVACAGALAGVGLTGLLSALLLGRGAALPLLVAPMGASAVLLFAVPASPLAQPWSIVGGNVLSALVGVAVGRLLPDPMLAAGVAVALAIGTMSLTRCLHPPGGAAALTAILGGPAVSDAGFLFPLVPVGLNALVLVAIGWLFHRLTRRSYPHVAAAPPASAHGTRDAPPQARMGLQAGDIDGALADLGETFDIDRADLARLLRQAELRALRRAPGDLATADIMSRDVIAVREDADPATARALLLKHGVRTLPVVDGADRVVGTVGLRELFGPGARVGEVMSDGPTIGPTQPAGLLVAALTDGRTHAVTVVDGERRILGIVTQTDLLAALARNAAAAATGQAAA